MWYIIGWPQIFFEAGISISISPSSFKLHVSSFKLLKRQSLANTPVKQDDRLPFEERPKSYGDKECHEKKKGNDEKRNCHECLDDVGNLFYGVRR